jgi:hypothetical protein
MRHVGEELALESTGFFGSRFVREQPSVLFLLRLQVCLRLFNLRYVH